MIKYVTEIDIKSLIINLIKKNIAFVSFSLPGEKDLNLFIRHMGEVGTFTDFSEIEGKTGFMFTPFNNSTEKKKYFFEPDIVMNENGIKGNIEKLLNEPLIINIFPKKSYETGSTSENEFIQGVVSIKNEISKGKIKKAVLSRVKELNVENLQDKIPYLFDILNTKYQEAFRYLISIPGEGQWMGASPEPLLQSNGEFYTTTSLAGTKYLNGSPIDDVSWTEKETEEQFMVSKYIIEKLKALNIKTFNLEGPYNYKAGRLAHLKTEFSFSPGFTNLSIGEIIETLHPTPSVCGYPADKALELINENENHQRLYYSGLIGPVNYKYSNHVFVNLRCMQAVYDHIILYAGAGITSGSNPEQEWEETGRKLETMFSVIKDGGIPC